MATILRGLNSPALQIIQEANKVARKLRYPIHNHALEYKPLQIRPFLIAPVLPGETMANLNMQARVVTDPLEPKFGNILPWWSEHYFYYVKARQLVKSEFEAMMLQGTSMGLNDAQNAVTYHTGGTIDWVDRCLKFIVENGGFRNEGEAWNAALIDGVPAAAGIRHRSNWLDSLTPSTELDPSDESETPDNSELQHPHALGHVMPELFEQYERMRSMQLIDMTFEDWLQTYGVSLPDAALLEKPELLRMVSEWSYPTNTVDPSTGAPTGAAVFSHNIRADKDRFFNEPGFIVGVTVLRPKVFMANQKGSAIQLMDSAYSWMPRMLADQPHISVRGFIGGNGDGEDPEPTGPLRDQTLGYWVDMRDLFTYGDQFISLAGDYGYVPALPTASGEKRYLTESMVDALFADKSPATAVLARQDGVTRLSIKGHPTTGTDMT